MYSKRGKQLRVVDGYKFRWHKNLKDEVERWLCTNKSCTAFIKFSACREISSNLNHNHSRDSCSLLLRQKVANACKRKAIEDLFERPSKMMRREMSSDALKVAFSFIPN